MAVKWFIRGAMVTGDEFPGLPETMAAVPQSAWFAAPLFAADDFFKILCVQRSAWLEVAVSKRLAAQQSGPTDSQQTRP